MTRFRYGIALTAVCATALLTGCGGGGEYATSQSADSAPAPTSQAQAGGAARDESSSNEARPEKVEQSGGDGVVSGVKVVQQDRQVIYTGSMTVRATQVTPAAQQAKQIATEAGGYLSQEESNASGDDEASAMLEFKIPVAKYPEVLRRLGGELGKQLSLNQNAQDVTLKVADVESRLKSAEQSLESLRTLLKRATTIGQVLDVEREISEREADLESLQAQQKQLAAQTTMATLTLRLVGPVTVVDDPADEPAGFLGGLAAGWRALVSFTKTALTVIGALLPWAAVSLPLIVLMVWLIRRDRRRPVPPPQPGPEAP
ncbi:DUF4349 domain-containing protein [Nonomuraea sp. PA05]|uniref:DUF4349 domain-containing protein n=1 Tax=Nonomuraea sp. PA05 TaxID=2604466 RepID=UPI0011DA2BCC|nr:DUF4349 domain-containing protein [Nonomuraea sp. PA05]TYB68528.1 DUF4349 domain-containing protein [Nonomuraea sp. PA05]